jgi:hypothetical protein
MAGWLNNKQMDKSLLLLFFGKEDSSFLQKRSKKLLSIAFALCG